MIINMKKIFQFIRSDNKWYLTKLAVYYIKQKIFYCWRFADFGKKSLVIEPIRFIGAKHISLGGGITVLNGARMEAIRTYGEQVFEPALKIGDNVSVGQNFHIICAGNLTIGNDVTISANVYISDVWHDYKRKDVHVLKQDLIVEHTRIGDNCFIGYGAIIQPGVVLGKQCIVGANAVVLKGDYPDYCVLAGVPARVVRRLDKKNGMWKKERRVDD